MSLENTAARRLSASKAQIQVIPRPENEISYPNCLVVDPEPGADGSSMVATVDHFVLEEESADFPWHIVPVVEEPIPFEEAMEAAAQYADEYAVPIILVNQDERKRPTNTAIRRLAP